LNDGNLRLERRNGAPSIFARTHLQGKYIGRSTREQTLPAATHIATDWNLELRDRIRKGESLHGPSFAQMAAAFIDHADLVREVLEASRCPSAAAPPPLTPPPRRALDVLLSPAVLHTPWRFMWNRCRTVWLALLHLEHPGLSLKSIPARRRGV
jgi:hypothetical protein